MFLLVTDLHLDSNPANEYRWQVFDWIKLALSQHEISHTFCLGDIVDRKDRFPGAFINRLLFDLKRISPIDVMQGNHDMTLHPPAFFSFVNEEFLSSRINYITKPTEFNSKLLLLPFSPKPKTEWQSINLRSYKCVFMHATVTGATENNQIFENPTFPMLPGDVKFYSGDIHTAQVVRNVTYVGCPHPIKFGDRFPCRMLVIDENTFEIVHEIITSPPRRLMLDVKSIDDLLKIKVVDGDQAKIRFSCDPSEIDKFGEIEAAIAAWSERTGIEIASTEVIVNSDFDAVLNVYQDHEGLLRQFAEHEGLSDDLVDVGLSLLEEAKEAA